MNLNEYLIENDRHIGDVVILNSVATALDKVSGDTFPMMVDNTIGVDEPVNLNDMDFDDDAWDWYEALSTTDKKIVIDCQTKLFETDYLEMKAESKCLTPPNISNHIKPPKIGGINNV